MKSQKFLVLNYLLKGKSISSRKAYSYWNIIRLSAIIYNLKKEGYEIDVEFRKNYTGVGRYAVYKLKNKKININFI